MTTAELFAQLRTQLADAAKPGLAGVRALEATAQTVNALEDAVKLIEQRHADRECVRLGHILRHVATRNRFTPRPRWHVQSTRRRGRECM